MSVSVSHWDSVSISLIPPWRVTVSSCTSGGWTKVNALRGCKGSKSHGHRNQSVLNIALFCFNLHGFAPLYKSTIRDIRAGGMLFSWHQSITQTLMTLSSKSRKRHRVAFILVNKCVAVQYAHDVFNLTVLLEMFLKQTNRFSFHHMVTYGHR